MVREYLKEGSGVPATSVASILAVGGATRGDSIELGLMWEFYGAVAIREPFTGLVEAGWESRLSITDALINLLNEALGHRYLLGRTQIYLLY